MDIFLKLGRTFFGVAVAAFGVLYLLRAYLGNTHVIGPPFFPGNLFLVWPIGLLFFVAGVSIIANQNTRIISALITLVLILQILFTHAPKLAANVHDPGPWTSGFEVLGICSGAWALAANTLKSGASKQKLLIAARISLACLLVVVGVQHFLYAQFIATLVQSWMPWHLFWAYFIGVAFFATALALVTGWFVRLATVMQGLMFFLFVFSLHMPRVMAMSHNGNEWTSMFVAAAMCGTAWILAGSVGQRTALKLSAAA